MPQAPSPAASIAVATARASMLLTRGHSAWPLLAQDNGRAEALAVPLIQEGARGAKRLRLWHERRNQPAAAARAGCGFAHRFGRLAVLPAPRFRRVQQRAHEAGVQRVARLVGHKAATNRRAGQREIANRVEQLVADEFVVEAKPFRVHNAAGVHNERVVHRSAAAEAGGAHGFDVGQEAERARVGDVVQEGFRRQLHAAALHADGGIGEADGDVEIEAVEAVRRQQRRALGAHAHFDRLKNADHALRRVLLFQAGVQQHLHERRGRTVEDRHFRAVHFDDQVVDAQAGAGRHQVLDGRDLNAGFVARAWCSCGSRRRNRRGRG